MIADDNRGASDNSEPKDTPQMIGGRSTAPAAGGLGVAQGPQGLPQLGSTPAVDSPVQTSPPSVVGSQPNPAAENAVKTHQRGDFRLGYDFDAGAPPTTPSTSDASAPQQAEGANKE